MTLEIEFRPARADEGDGARLLKAMRDEMAELYEGLNLDDASMPKAGPDDLSPPRGAFIVGWHDGNAVCCGGVKELPDGTCEIKRMYVAPEVRRNGVATQLLSALEDEARRLGYSAVRLDTGPRQPHAADLYRRSGYVEIDNFNGNPIATFHAEKPL